MDVDVRIGLGPLARPEAQPADALDALAIERFQLRDMVLDQLAQAAPVRLAAQRRAAAVARSEPAAFLGGEGGPLVRRHGRRDPFVDEQALVLAPFSTELPQIPFMSARAGFWQSCAVA